MTFVLEDDEAHRRTMQAFEEALPPAPVPVGMYVPVTRAGELLFTAGHTSAVQGRLDVEGQVGADVTTGRAREAAATAVLNCLSSLRSFTGSLTDIADIVSMVGYVNSSPDFRDHPGVLDGASEVLLAAFGEHGRPARAAVGVSSLPGGAPVEITLVARLRQTDPRSSSNKHAGSTTDLERGRAAPQNETSS